MPVSYTHLDVYKRQTVGGAFPGTTIGTLSSTASSGTISCTVLAGTTPGSIYRIRVIASNPNVTGSNNGTNLTVQQSVGAAGSVTGTATAVSYTHLDSLLVSYPFSKEKYGHAQFGWGGGMEHQTMSFVGSFGYELIAHELVHQWFGDKITCSSWRDIWLHEGFATFFAGAAIERFKPEEYYAWKYSALQSIISKPNGLSLIHI